MMTTSPAAAPMQECTRQGALDLIPIRKSSICYAATPNIEVMSKMIKCVHYNRLLRNSRKFGTMSNSMLHGEEGIPH
jgi:hypothetical protein